MVDDRPSYFVVLAGMRTGSNFLEEQISTMPGLQSFGELFNPHFFGKPKSDSQFGFSLEERDREPIAVIDRMVKASDGLPGFRLFYDHDARVIDHVLSDQRAAKIVLTRRPLDSYVSLKIARKTGQWWLGDLSSARSAKVPFVLSEYAEFLNRLRAFQLNIRRKLQVSGQVAFNIDYAELSDSEVVDGLGAFLGVAGSRNKTHVRAKVQNPTPARERLTNPEEADAELARLAATDPDYIPSHEPERGPGLRHFLVCETAPLIYMPIRGAGRDPVPEWMRAVDTNGTVQTGLTQKELRRWMRTHPGHRSFTVLRHPLPRAYDAYCETVLPVGVAGYADIRHALIERYGVELPADATGESWTVEKQSKAFLGFLKFLEGNLGGQTSLRVDSTWASQFAFLDALARFSVPDRIIREDTLKQELRDLLRGLGLTDAPDISGTVRPGPDIPLSDINSDEIEKTCARAYRRDFVFFGFSDWSGSGQAA